MADETQLATTPGPVTDLPPLLDPTASLRRQVRRNALTLATLGVALLMWLVFIVAAPEVFLSTRIYTAFATTTPLFAMVALALTLVVITREMDLSFGSVMALSMVGFVKVYGWTGSVVLAVLACLLVGALCGLLNGFLVAILNIPSLVITLGTLFLFRGIEMVLISGRPTVLRDPEFDWLRSLLTGKVGDIPNQVLWTIAMAIVLWIVLNRTRFGAHIFLVGDNPTSAQLMGVRVARVRIATFVILAVVAAFTGMMSAMYIGTFFPTLAEGTGALLNPIASVFIGGTSVFGGMGSIVGTFIGAFVVGAINAGVVSAGMDGFYTELFFGLVIVLSLVLQTLITRWMRR
ncbi:MAG TPA: ABC transporter permease [Natronosporangium sp.]